LARAVWPALPALALALAMSGCGNGDASPGATVTAYVAAPLCKGAELQLRRHAAGVAGLRVRVVCLPSTASGSRVVLARIGANARRATEDSTAIAYLEVSGPGARFSKTIVESAGIAWTATSSGSDGMRRVLNALGSGDTSSPRATVREALGG
jgi:hypothetical protein